MIEQSRYVYHRTKAWYESWDDFIVEDYTVDGQTYGEDLYGGQTIADHLRIIPQCSFVGNQNILVHFKSPESKYTQARLGMIVQFSLCHLPSPLLVAYEAPRSSGSGL